ncbi:GerMN domain-containing protein [Ruania halotolerans]|uniref:GerMN domain-containing protein n=1 Tax=Ruania halotolerans TaxID=2897773 RepID=UPI001E343CA1|nr:GerMN domain-containing protein [Ruania halotolerans]UFU05357.1 GerMN domain-containing protein [Ruania halotolerans]
MNRRLRPVALLVSMLALAGCGVQPSQVQQGPEAPTGLAPGSTLYFLDDGGDLVAQERQTRRLGSIQEAVSLLLTGPGSSGLGTGIAETAVRTTPVTLGEEIISVRLPLATPEVDSDGVDQIVCTVLATHIQAGGSPAMQVRLTFTDIPASSTDPRTGPRSCPVL